MGYYLISQEREKFCVPYNLIVIEIKGKKTEVELNPSELEKGVSILIDEKRMSYAGRTIEKIQIPDCSIERLRELCFSGRIRKAVFCAEALFLWVRSIYKRREKD